MGKPLQGHTDIVYSVAFSPDGRHIVSGSMDYTVQVWDAQAGIQVGKPLQGHTNGVWSVAFSPDGTHIVSGSEDCTIQVWDAQTGVQVGKPLQGHTGSVWSVAFSPDGKHIVSGSADHTIQVWDLQVDLQGSLKQLALPNVFPLVHLSSVMPPDSDLSSNSDPIGMNMTRISKRHLTQNFYLQEDNGWIVGQNDELLLWVPPSYHPFTIHNPQQPRLIISAFPVIDLSHIVHCSSWHEWFTSHAI